MAQIHRYHFHFSTFITLSLISFALSSSMHYQELDVKASMQRTKTFLSHSPQKIKEENVAATPTSSLSFTINSRAAIVVPKEKDYAALTEARLARDAARVDSLMTHLKLSLHNFTTFEQAKIQAPLISGFSHGVGEHLTRVGVGQPVKQFYMAIDTGSDISWLQCQPCSQCYTQFDPIFNPASSTTYKSVSCASQQCKALDVAGCQANSCLYEVSYVDGSYTVGDFATESITFGSGASISNIGIGCGRQNVGFAYAAGILGLGRETLSFPSQIKATSFSYCLVNFDSDSTSTLEFNSARPSDSVVVSLIRNPKIDTFYYLPIIGISVGGIPISVPESVFAIDARGNGGAIIDSGTTVTRFPVKVYNLVRDSFVKQGQNFPKSSGVRPFDTCFDFSSVTSVNVPIVAFRFVGGKTLPLHPDNYLIPVDSAGKYCFAFASTPDSVSVIGNIQQQGTRVSYDLANNLIGFSADKC